MRSHVLASLVVTAGMVLLPHAVLAQAQQPNPDTSPHPMPPTQPGTSTPAPVRPSPPATGAAAPSSPSAAAARAAEGLRASTVIGSDVYNDNNEKIGSVRDLLLAPQGGPMTVIVSVGGFLGIGSKDVAVPFDEMQWQGERERWLLPGATAESLKDRPAFTFRDGDR